MGIKTFLLAGAAAGFLATPLLAVSQDAIDAIVADLAGQGFTRLEIKDYGDTLKVEASGPTGHLERVYDAAGGVLKSETSSGEPQGPQAGMGQGDHSGDSPSHGSHADDDHGGNGYHGAGSDDAGDDDEMEAHDDEDHDQSAGSDDDGPGHDAGDDDHDDDRHNGKGKGKGKDGRHNGKHR